MNKLKKLLMINLLTFCIIHNAFAGHLYQINLIVFKHLAGLNSKHLKNEPKQPQLKDVLELKHAKILSNYYIVPENKKGLQSEANILRKHSQYQLLLHTSWIQEINSTQYAKWIHIFGGKSYPQNLYELNGKIKISQYRFFDIDTDLYLTVPHISTQWLGNSLQSFVLNEKRRTALNKINYLDHPLFGVLIQIVPFKTS